MVNALRAKWLIRYTRKRGKEKKTALMIFPRLRVLFHSPFTIHHSPLTIN